MAPSIKPRQCERGVTQHVYVVQTYAVAFSDAPGIQYYEIHMAPEQDAEAPRVALVTADPRIIQRALAAEDLDRRFEVSWHRISSPFGAKYQIDRFDDK